MFVLDQPPAVPALEYVQHYLFLLCLLPRFPLVTHLLLQLHSFLFLLVVSPPTGVDHGVQLRYHDGTLRNTPKIAPSKLIYKMAESKIILFLALHILNRQLQLTLHPPHEQIIHNDVVSRVIQFVLDPDQFEFPLHTLTIVQQIHRF